MRSKQQRMDIAVGAAMAGSILLGIAAWTFLGLIIAGILP